MDIFAISRALMLATAMETMAMPGMYGPYSATREASGTAWQPDSTPHPGLHIHRDEWMFMVHGMAHIAYTQQGGNRDVSELYSTNSVMATARRALGPGALGLRTMLSLEPATVGQGGYPLLLQTGETADGVTPLIDRQHAHDFFMELAASYSVNLGDESSAFVYAGLPGEPALGPVAFMHRWSGLENPEAPLGHHWQDSTHITFGVLTLGGVWRDWKLEGSAFRGREPDQHRWNIEAPELDSYSGRLSWNPTQDWSLQASAGYLNSPEQLHPEIDTVRVTASASRNVAWEGGKGQATFIWGRNYEDPGHESDAFLLEGTAYVEDRILMVRGELVEKDHLFLSPDPRENQQFDVWKVSTGYMRDFDFDHVSVGLGAELGLHFLPEDLKTSYGDFPLSVLVFTRIRL